MKKDISMRILVYVLLLTICVISFSIFMQRLLYADAEELTKSIEKMEEHAWANNWKEAGYELDRTMENWSGTKKTWSALIDHQEIDNIDVTLSRLQVLIRGKESADALSEAAVLKKYVSHIPDTEKLTWKNIF